MWVNKLDNFKKYFLIVTLVLVFISFAFSAVRIETPIIGKSDPVSVETPVIEGSDGSETTVTSSNTIIDFLRILNKNVYLGSTTVIEDKKDDDKKDGGASVVSSSKDIKWENLNFNNIFIGKNQTICLYYSENSDDYIVFSEEKDAIKYDYVDFDGKREEVIKKSNNFLVVRVESSCKKIIGSKGENNPIFEMSATGELWNSGSKASIKLNDNVYSLNSDGSSISGKVGTENHELNLNEEKTIGINVSESRKLILQVEAETFFLTFFEPNRLTIRSISTIAN